MYWWSVTTDHGRELPWIKGGSTFDAFCTQKGASAKSQAEEQLRPGERIASYFRMKPVYGFYDLPDYYGRPRNRRNAKSRRAY